MPKGLKIVLMVGAGILGVYSALASLVGFAYGLAGGGPDSGGALFAGFFFGALFCGCAFAIWRLWRSLRVPRASAPPQ